jgi:hypothetical protein
MGNMPTPKKTTSSSNQRKFRNTVDGRNPAPVDRWFIPLFIGFQPSKVMQDFFHPPYHDGLVLDLCMTEGGSLILNMEDGMIPSKLAIQQSLLIDYHWEWWLVGGDYPLL